MGCKDEQIARKAVIVKDEAEIYGIMKVLFHAVYTPEETRTPDIKGLLGSRTRETQHVAV